MVLIDNTPLSMVSKREYLSEDVRKCHSFLGDSLVSEWISRNLFLARKNQSWVKLDLSFQPVGEVGFCLLKTHGKKRCVSSVLSELWVVATQNMFGIFIPKNW